ncbi:MAG: hypothetical protein Q8Q09_19365 [Deltaproteobacteria bacterium]|nr:hypothetical protein [Deltaproteobacteria bacterium]
MRVNLVQRTSSKNPNETIGAVVSVRSGIALYACTGPDAAVVLLALVSWCHQGGYTITESVEGRVTRRRRRSDAA